MFRLFFTCVALLLAGLFYYPENDVLQKFDIVVTLWCNFVFFVYLTTSFAVIRDTDTKNKLREGYKTKTFLTKFYDNLLCVIFFVFLILNGMSYCTVVFFIAAIMSFLIEQSVMEDK